MRTANDLRQLQALPLSLKIRLTQDRIRQWVNEFGENGVYIAFSGGKDSTVLLHLVRELYANVPAVFCDTGLEYPEIRGFIKTFDNVEWLKPKMPFKKVIETYGYPFISKEVSGAVDEVRIRREKGLPLTTSNAVRLFGQHKDKNGEKSMFNKDKYLFLLDAPFRVSNKCCYVMKKSIASKYNRQTGRKAFTGQMASESLRRTQAWLKNGCNAFQAKKQVSNPMAFWLEDDVLQYIREKQIPICSVYGDIVEVNEIEGQMNWNDYIGFDIGRVHLTTTGCKRTGCMFCGYGCHLEKPGEGRFERMKQTHPKQYEWIMKDWDKGGLGYKNVIDWLNENGNLNIRY